MHIHQIEIDNFKSFAEKTVIPFYPGFTTVSGPNGSGKSNIIDSVLFCLGLSSSRTMRAEKLTDLINHLSKRREAIVNITFSKVPVQPGTAPNPEDLLTVARRIKDGPSGYTSTYYLNGKPSTLTDIHDHLSQFNISPGCYNVMMQGDVAGIVNMSAMERRKIIDEIAGVAEFDRKIEQAQKELEAAGDNIERNTLLLSEIESRLQQLESEREHALKYQALKEEKQTCEGQLVAAQYFSLKRAIQAAHDNMAAARRQKEEATKTLQILCGQIEETRGSLIALSNEVKRKGEDQQIAIKKQIEGLKGHIARNQDKVRLLDQQKVDNLKSIERMEGEILRQRENIETIQTEIEGFEHQLKEIQVLFQKEADACEALNKQFDQLTDSSGELSVQRSETRQKLEAMEDTVAKLHREKQDLEGQCERIQQDQTRWASEQQTITQRRQGILDKQTLLTTQVEDLTQEKQGFELQLKQTQLQYSQARVALNQAGSNYQQLHRNYLQAEAQKKAYEEVHFGRAVDTILRAGLSGVHGTLAQLGEADSEYSLALEIALGGRLQNIVVDDDTVAQHAIELLQRSKSGRATFLPLTKIQPSRGLPRLPGHAGVIDFAYQLMSFDHEYADVFAYALGETLIVEDMAAARSLLRQYRMVTLDGSLLEKSGAMTGGSTPNQGSAGSRLGNNRKRDQELEVLLAKLDEAEAEKNRVEKQLTQLELKLERLKEQYNQCTQQHARAVLELENIQQQLADLDRVMGELQPEEDSPDRLAPLQKRLKEIETEMGQAEIAAQGLREALAQIDHQLPADAMEELRKAMADVKFQRDHYEAQIRNVQSEIKGKHLEQHHQTQGIQHYQERIQEVQNQFAEMDKEKKAAFEEIELTAKQIQELEAQTSELDEELKKLQQERDQVQTKLIDEERQKHILEQQVNQLGEQILSFQARKRELEPQVQEAKQVLEAMNLPIETLKEADLPVVEVIQHQIQKLTRKMESMEPVNMLAIKEYDEVKVRQQEFSEKIETLGRERETLTVKISSYQELKRVSFMKSFESVDHHFKTIFAELSDGMGQLVLTNAEEPFSGGLTIQAQPRGKKMQRMEAMSGGEKSLTSLAFVFALQRTMPAPFYALDEVDMNLDGINAEKLANMVKRESQTAQFVVVSLRKPMLEHSDRTIGVTQKRDGVSKVTGVKLRGGETSPEETGSPIALAS